MPERTPPTPISHYEVDLQNVHHSETRLPDGRPSLLIDPGSVANLCGDKWAQECAKMAMQHGVTPSQNKRTRPFEYHGRRHWEPNVYTRLHAAYYYVSGK